MGSKSCQDRFLHPIFDYKKKIQVAKCGTQKIEKEERREDCSANLTKGSETLI